MLCMNMYCIDVCICTYIIKRHGEGIVATESACRLVESMSAPSDLDKNTCIAHTKKMPDPSIYKIFVPRNRMPYS